VSARPESGPPTAGRSPRIGGALGVLLQLAAGIVVLVVLFAVLEFVTGRFVDDQRLVNRKTQALELTSKGGDPVATNMRTLEMYPAVNPSPLVTDVIFLWRNMPLARKTQPVNPQPFGLDESWTVENNSLGYRGPELEFTRRGEEVFRVVCVGDSITFGFNVDQEDSYPRQLQRLLRERHPGRRIEVINTGVPGWSWYQGLRFVELEGLALHPSLVIAAHGTNDQFLSARVTDRERLAHVENPLVRALLLGGARLSRTNTYRLLTELLPAPGEATQDSAACRAQRKAGSVCHRLSLDDIAQAVTELGARTSAAGVPLLLLNLDFPQTRAVEGSRAAAQRSNIPFLDFVARIGALREADATERSNRLGLLPARLSPRPRRAHAHHVILRVQVDHPAGPVSVRGYYDYSKPQFQFEAAMYDDGTHSDQIPNDGVYSAVVEVPPAVASLDYNYFVGDTPELQGLPPLPSTMGNRRLPVGDEDLGPVEVFGRLFMMAEQTHPNREGQAVVATGIADWIDRQDGLRRAVDRAGN
jgi:lysophospholipase L1-like esterase